MSPEILRYCLFVDESGFFTGKHPDEAAMKEIQETIEKTIAKKTRTGTGDHPSQIAGFLVKETGCPTEETAREILSQAWKKAGLDEQAEYHLKDVKDQKLKMKIGHHVWDEAKRLNLQPARITARAYDTSTSPFSYGCHEQTYVHLFAEMLLRVFEKIRSDNGPDNRTFINITGASVKCADSEETIDCDKYRRAIDGQFSFFAVRKGFSDLLNKTWQYNLSRPRPAKESYRLQLCDVLSNTSFWAGDPRFDPDLAKKIRNTFGAWDFKSLFVAESEEKLEEMIERGEVAAALLQLCSCREEWQSRPPLKGGYFKVKKKALLSLVAMDDESCSQQLRVLTDWLHRLGSINRQLETTKEAIAWMKKEVAVALERNKKPAHSREFAWHLDILLLETLNHLGNLTEAREVAKRLEEMIPSFSSRLDYFPTLAKALNLQSVHLTDCLDYESAVARIEPVAVALKSLGDSLSKSFPIPGATGTAAGFLSSDLGKAVGSWLQAEASAGLSDPARLEFARRLSDEALRQFEKPGDKKRQLQYRSIIEAYSGDFQKARNFLAESLSNDTGSAVDPTHSGILQRLSSVPFAHPNFPLLHWTRIGAEAVRAGNEPEARSFFDAFRSSPLREGLLRREVGDTPEAEKAKAYPMHGTLRNLAFVHAALEDEASCKDYLKLLEEITPANGSGFNILSLYPVFSAAECVAALIKAGIHDFRAEDALDHLGESMEKLKREAQPFPKVLDRIEALSGTLRAARKNFHLGGNSTDPDEIIKAARRLPC